VVPFRFFILLSHPIHFSRTMFAWRSLSCFVSGDTAEI